MYENIIDLINDEEYEKAKKIIIKELENNNNPDLWYLLFLVENNNYLDFDSSSINNTYAYNQATKSDNEEYELEFKLFKDLANSGLNKIFRLIQIEKYKEADELLKKNNNFKLEISKISLSYLSEIVITDNEEKNNYYLKFINYVYNNTNNKDILEIKNQLVGYINQNKKIVKEKIKEKRKEKIKEKLNKTTNENFSFEYAKSKKSKIIICCLGIIAFIVSFIISNKNTNISLIFIILVSIFGLISCLLGILSTFYLKSEKILAIEEPIMIIAYLLSIYSNPIPSICYLFLFIIYNKVVYNSVFFNKMRIQYDLSSLLIVNAISLVIKLIVKSFNVNLVKLIIILVFFIINLILNIISYRHKNNKLPNIQAIIQLSISIGIYLLSFNI